MAKPNPSKRRLRDEAAALACPQEKAQVYYRDTEEPSLRLRVTRAGVRVWDWRRGNTTKLIGIFPAVGYEEAKAKADAWSQAVERGRDARAVVLDAEMANTVQDLFDAYVPRKIEDNSRKRKPNESKANVLSQTRPLRDRYGDLPLLDL